MRRFNSSSIAARLFMSSKKLADANVYSQALWFTQTVGFIIQAIIDISFSWLFYTSFVYADNADVYGIGLLAVWSKRKAILNVYNVDVRGWQITKDINRFTKI